jgi:cytochrome c oxidase subunit II
MRRLALAAFAPPALLAQQSALDPAGPDAGAIRALLVFFVVLLGAIFLLVVAMTIIPLVRRHRGIDQEPLERTHRPSANTELRLKAVTGVATVATILILFGLVVLSVSVGKATSSVLDRANSMVVEVTGNQWWWHVRYANDDASRIAVTANEMHIPVGRPVMIRATSNDVIHSFWAPNLQGKRDLFPKHITTEWFQADRPGRFRGQCAEFCGLQHAHMALWVVAEPPAKFESWLAHQLEPSVAPSGDDQKHGQEVFLNNACAMCHTIAGTGAAGQVGPDLTHFGTRLTIAAGTLPNSKGNLAGWIADPQSVKPGNHMATVPIKPEDMQPLIDYLESLR